MPTFRASNGKWLSIPQETGGVQDQSGQPVTASCSEDPAATDHRTSSDFLFLPARTELWWSDAKHDDRPVLISGSKLQIFQRDYRPKTRPRLFVMNNVIRPGELTAQLMDPSMRGSGNVVRWESVFTIHKVIVDPGSPGRELTYSASDGSIRNGDSVALQLPDGSYLEVDAATDAVMRGAQTVRKGAVFSFHSQSDLSVALHVDRAMSGSVRGIHLLVQDEYTKVPIPATFDLGGSPFSVHGSFDANTWIDSTFDWDTGAEAAGIPLTWIDTRPLDPWVSSEILRFEPSDVDPWFTGGKAVSWVIGRDGAT